MKQILSIAVLISGLLLLSFSESPYMRKGRSGDVLLGDVKKVTKKEYKGVTWSATTETDYNEKGQETSIIKYSEDGNILSSVALTYDERGNTLDSIQLNADGSQKSKISYEYDSLDHKIETKFYNADDYIRAIVSYRYNQQGYKTEAAEYKTGDTLVYRNSYRYDDKGHMTEKYEYRPKGNMDRRTLHSYDEKGREIRSEEYSPKDSILSVTLHKYHDEENKTEVYFYSIIPHTSYRDINYFDRKGNKIKNDRHGLAPLLISKGEVILQDLPSCDTLQYRKVWEYNQHDDITQYIYYDSEGIRIEKKCESAEYQYDKKGNCIQKIVRRNDLIQSEMIRKIEYY